MALDELSNKKLIKRFAADSSFENESELFNRLENNEFTDAEIIEICMILLDMRESGEW